jgi:hypothetical protein
MPPPNGAEENRVPEIRLVSPILRVLAGWSFAATSAAKSVGCKPLMFIFGADIGPLGQLQSCPAPV